MILIDIFKPVDMYFLLRDIKIKRTRYSIKNHRYRTENCCTIFNATVIRIFKIFEKKIYRIF